MTGLDFRPAVMFADTRLTLAGNVWLYVLAAALALVLAILVYRFTLPPVRRVRRTILWLLRGTALVLLLLMLFEPLLTFVRSRLKPPVVALLVDKSASMSVLNRSEDRPRQVTSALSGRSLRDIARQAELRTFAFADSVVALPLDSVSETPARGVGSDIAGAWTRVQKALAAENLAAVILVTDGAYNLGENPARVAASVPFPIYAVGVGDTVGQADAYVVEIATNEFTYAGSRVPVDIRVQARGLAGKSSFVRLWQGGSEIGRQEVQFAADEAEVAVSLSFEAHEAGDLRITASVDSVAGESETVNNRRSVIVRVLERKARVFLFAGMPSADLTILRQALEADTTLETVVRIEAGGGRYLYGGPDVAGDAGSASLIVLCDFPTSRTPQSVVEEVARAVTERRVPLLFMAGPHVSLSRMGALRPVLPLESARQVLSEEPVVLRAAAGHSALTGSTPLPADWADLPPVWGGAGNFAVTGGGQIAAKISREMLGVTEDEPGVVLWEGNGRRTAAILCWGTARWKLQLAGSSSGASFYEEFFARLRGWLVAPVEQQRVRIRTSKKLYSAGEPARFSAQVYGADMSPRDDAVLTLQVSSGTRTETVVMRGRGNGRYEAELSPWVVGEYRFTGSAVVGGDTLGADRGLFAVEPFNIELLDPRARFDVLRQVAQVTGGGFATADQADTVLARIALVPRTVVTRRDIPLWRQGPLIWLVIALLAAEWLLRKRSGML